MPNSGGEPVPRFSASGASRRGSRRAPSSRGLTGAAPPTGARRPPPRTAAPSTIPTASGPPPPAIVCAIIATPSTTISADSTAVSGLTAAPSPSRARAGACGRTGGRDSMITRQGRSASTVSIVLPNTDAPEIALGQREHDGRRAHVLRLLDDPAAGLPGAHLLPVPGDAPAALQLGLLDDRVGGRLGLGHRRVDLRARSGTMIVTSTWMPRRLRAASLIAVAIRCSSCQPSPTWTSTESYSASWSTTGWAIATLCVEVRSRPWRRRNAA